MKAVAGRDGQDCVRACVASILELRYDDVPDLYALTARDQNEQVRQFLRNHGLYLQQKAFAASQIQWPGYHLMAGLLTCKEGVFPHCTVAWQGRVVHCPAGLPNALTPVYEDKFCCGFLHRVPKYDPEYPKPFLSL